MFGDNSSMTVIWSQSSFKMGPFPYRAPRMPLLAYADVFGGGRHIGAVQLHNISAYGLGGNGLSYCYSETLQVQLSGIGQVNAKLIWIDGMNFGLKFDEKIRVDAFDLGGPNSGAQPFTLTQATAGLGHQDDHIFPDVEGEGCFVRADGGKIDVNRG